MKKFTLCIFMLCAFAISMVAQRTVSGTVTDENDETLIGVTVTAKGSSVGTATDFEGKYTLEVPNGTQILVFSYTGFEKQEVALGASNMVDLVLREGSIALDEIIVTGYSEVEARKLVSAVSVVGAEDIENVPMPDINQIIQGKAAGVYSTAASGQPGAAQNIRIRGTGSITAGRGPLYVVDGIIINTGDLTQQTATNDILSNMNPGDIDNVTVLKDASATALYGARGSNGVILITTKRGKAGKTKLTAKYQRGTTSPLTGNFQMMDAQQAWDYERKILANSGRDQQAIDDARPASLLDDTNDWVESAFRDGISQNIELSASGGSQNTRFFLSGGVFEQEGTLIESDFARYSLRANLDHTASDKLSFGLNLNGSLTDNTNATAGNRFASPLLGAFVNTPLQSPINPATGEFYTGQEAEFVPFVNDNFLYSLPLNPVNNQNFRLLAKLTGKYNILENLSFTQNLNIDFINIAEKTFADPTTNDGINDNGTITQANTQNRALTSQSLLKYITTLGDKHNFDFLAGFEYNRVDQTTLSASGNGLASGKLKTLASTAEPASVGGIRTDYSFASVLGQMNYNFDDKYYITASARRDGSSRFSADNKYATFWSVGASWLISNESFMQNSSFINDLKLRVSYGTVGNAAIGNFASLGLYGFGSAYDNNPGAAPSQIANPDLTWETANVFNVGLDFSVLKNRIGASIEYYRRVSQDLLLNVPVSSTSGFTTATQNIGEMENTGVEAIISFVPFRSKARDGFNWEIDLNVSFNNNKILSLPGGEDILNGGQIYREGFPIRSHYRQVWEGVNPDDGTPLWSVMDADGNISTTGNYTEADRRIVGNAEPDWIGGLTNTFSFKGVTLSAFFYTAQGHELYNSSRRFIESDGQRYGWNHIVEAGDHWENPGDVAERPQPLLGGNNAANSNSTRYLEDASFIRLRNIQLGYRLPNSLLDKIGLGGVHLYLQGQNLWTSTNYSGFDPEASENGSEFFRYPVGKSITFGADINF